MALKIEGSTPSVHPTPNCDLDNFRAPVAQGTEHLASNQRVGGSNPSGRAIPIQFAQTPTPHDRTLTAMDVESGLIAVLAFGFLLGLKHATDADHVVAVANIVGKERNILQSIWLGASWGAGHSVPLLLLGTVVLIAKDFALHRYETIAPYFEIGVGIMLIYLGISAAWNVLRGNLHIHQHDHGDGPHIHVHASHSHQESHQLAKPLHNSFFILGRPVFRVRSFAIGIVHGLAGSAAVMVALLPTIDSTLAGLGYIALFSVGTMLAMSALTIVLAIPFKISAARQTLNRAITLTAGTLSIAVGAILITEILFETTIMPF